MVVVLGFEVVACRLVWFSECGGFVVELMVAFCLLVLVVMDLAFGFDLLCVTCGFIVRIYVCTGCCGWFVWFVCFVLGLQVGFCVSILMFGSGACLGVGLFWLFVSLRGLGLGPLRLLQCGVILLWGSFVSSPKVGFTVVMVWWLLFDCVVLYFGVVYERVCWLFCCCFDGGFVSCRFVLVSLVRVDCLCLGFAWFCVWLTYIGFVLVFGVCSV